MTNKDLADGDEVFQRACKLAGVEPSRRQYSKWKLGQGKAWPFYTKVLDEVLLTFVGKTVIS